MPEKVEITLEKIAEELRGSLSGWDFKQYIFAIIFYRFYSQKVSLHTPDPEDLANSLTQIFDEIESSSPEMEGLFADLNFHSEKLGKSPEARNRRLAGVLSGIDLGLFESQSSDVFGDVYEYLLGMYARDSRQSGGEFYTPQGVSELLARIVMVGKEEVKNVYDPTCGSGSLLLKLIGKASSFYGQEVNPTTYNLCRMNMILHGIPFENYDIKNDCTLSAPQHEDQFEAIVSNPPYSIHWDPVDLADDPRFAPAGVHAPKQYADLAFVMHILSRLATDGTAAVVCYPGALYRTGKEQKIRQYLIESNFVEAAIGLPKDLFYGTSIDTIVLVLKKNKTDKKVLFINASNTCVKAGTRNEMRAEHLDKIIHTYEKREDVPRFARLVSNAEVLGQDAKILPKIYIETAPPKKEIDIIKLNADLKKISLRNQILRERFDATMKKHMEDYITTGRVLPHLWEDSNPSS